MITKILVANRGEIARRVFRTCRAHGHRHGRGVLRRRRDGALRAARPTRRSRSAGRRRAESYLRIDAVIAAAERVGADAIHPGYGFLSENAEFARRCEKAGIIFIGPTVEAIERWARRSRPAT